MINYPQNKRKPKQTLVSVLLVTETILSARTRNFQDLFSKD